MSLITSVALLVFLTIHEGTASSVGEQGLNLRCRCINKENKPIGRHILLVEINPANSHCMDTEIIATLKADGLKVCLDPDAPWVRKVLEKTRADTMKSKPSPKNLETLK